MARGPDRHLNILFTGVGRRVELMRAFRRAYTQLGVRGQIIGVDVDALAPALRVVDLPLLVPSVGSADYVPHLVDLCRSAGVDLIFPLTDRDIPLLSHHRDIFAATGARVVLPPDTVIRTADDKWQTTQFFGSIGIRTPETWLPDDVDSAALPLPLFIKPRCGSAAKHAYPVNTVRELEFYLEHVPHPMIQQFLSGPEITSDVICSSDGALLGFASRRRLEVRNGEVAKAVTVFDPQIMEACRRIAQALPAQAPITVQCIVQEGVPYFTEINARMGGGLPLAIAAGVDAPLLLLASATDCQISMPPLGSYSTELYFSRFDDSFVLTEGDRLRVQRYAMTGVTSPPRWNLSGVAAGTGSEQKPLVQ